MKSFWSSVLKFVVKAIGEAAVQEVIKKQQEAAAAEAAKKK